jgi:hypothetical protein
VNITDLYRGIELQEQMKDLLDLKCDIETYCVRAPEGVSIKIVFEGDGWGGEVTVTGDMLAILVPHIEARLKDLYSQFDAL